MAVLGTLIVMTGLAVLSLVISQLYRLVALFERRKEAATVCTEPPTALKTTRESSKTVDFPLADLEEAARRCMAQAASLGAIFELKALIQILKETGWPAPHLTLRTFRESGVLIPAGEGRFAWKE